MPCLSMCDLLVNTRYWRVNISKKVRIKQFLVNTISYVWFRSRKLVRKLSAFVIQSMEREKKLSGNLGHNILELRNILKLFLFTTCKAVLDIYYKNISTRCRNTCARMAFLIKLRINWLRILENQKIILNRKRSKFGWEIA